MKDIEELKLSRRVRVDDDYAVMMTYKGSVTLQLKVQGEKRVVKFTDIHFYSEFGKTKLLLVAQLVEKELRFYLNDDNVLNFVDIRTNKVTLQAPKRGRMFPLKM